MNQGMKFHPYAEIFPLLDDAALGELADDVKSFGLREKIWLYDGKILDGRNRYLACRKAKIEPEYRTFKGTEPGALAFVVSANIHRRQLTTEQRAMAAARVATLRQGANQHLPKNIAESGEHTARAASSQAQAAAAFKVSPDSIQRARKVVEKGSKALQRAAESGEVSLKKAASVTDLPKSEQLAAAKEPSKPQYTDAQLKAIATEYEGVADSDMPTAEEIAEMDAAIDREYSASIAKVMEADDKLAAANAEIKRQAAEIAALKVARDGQMNGKSAAIQQFRAKERECDRLKRDLQRANDKIRDLTDRIAQMEEAA